MLRKARLCIGVEREYQQRVKEAPSARRAAFR
jgi:hypothetical protein